MSSASDHTGCGIMNTILPPNLVVRPLSDGPAPLRAGIFLRRGVEPSALERELISRARQRFLELTKPRRRRP
jgi:hypothetical protein